LLLSICRAGRDYRQQAQKLHKPPIQKAHDLPSLFNQEPPHGVSPALKHLFIRRICQKRVRFSIKGHCKASPSRTRSISKRPIPCAIGALPEKRWKNRRRSWALLQGARAFKNFAEGRCLQILHIGAYDDEAPTLARLHDELTAALQEAVAAYREALKELTVAAARRQHDSTQRNLDQALALIAQRSGK
jgi:hypothetical protein